MKKVILVNHYNLSHNSPTAMTSQARPSAIHNMTATTSEVATAQKRKRPSSSIRDKFDEMQLQVLKKESNKLDLEIENLLLQREKLQLEIEHIKSRFHHEQQIFKQALCPDPFS